MEYNWDEFSFEEKLFCNRAEFAIANKDVELIKMLIQINPELFCYVNELFEKSLKEK